MKTASGGSQDWVSGGFNWIGGTQDGITGGGTQDWATNKSGGSQDGITGEPSGH